ncbi:Aste57867_7334 [Aphanomyces stellatus]|nr:hypothetical protein As57867_007308 [Aphanomyces stellatus]VFT84252.1 Aste57867_7334 [Aphanomyces stellatus]
MSRDDVLAQVSQRTLWLPYNTGDIQPGTVLDDSCEANAQGPLNRFARQQNYVAHLTSAFPGKPIKTINVDGCKHDAACFYHNSAVQALILQT